MRSVIKYQLLVISVFAFSIVQAQQLPQLTQYQFNDYVINPAIAGSRPFFEFRSGHRYQWLGINDAPRTYVFSVSTPVASNMGVGAMLYTDVVGPTRRAGFQASYAYHLKLTDDLKLGFALSGGIVQYEIDGSKISFHDPGDPVIDDQIRRDLVGDAKFGFHLYSDKFWFGASAPQLFQNNLAWLQDESESLSKLEDHYYASAGYKWSVNEDIQITPSILVKYVDPVPVKIDASFMVSYQNAFWIGGGWRSEDALTTMLGATVGETFQFGYSYDMTTTALDQYSNGTHELMVGIRVAKQHVSASESTAGQRKAERKLQKEELKKTKREAQSQEKVKKPPKGPKVKKKKEKKDKGEGSGSDDSRRGNRDKSPDLIIQ